jgi:DNA (cytosine-5)-methyltransferase 1
VFDQGSPVPLDYLCESEELTFRKKKRLLSKIYAEKARVAIQNLYGEGGGSASEFNSISLNFNFSDKLIIEEDKKGSYFGEVELINNEAKVRVVNGRCDVWKTLTITPIKNWSLDVDRILLSWNGEELIDYVVAWKFLENQLRLQNIKSDLVQLAGYYQYQPYIKIEWCDISSNLNKDYQVLKSLTSNEFTREAIDQDVIFEIIDEHGCEPVNFLKQLKNIGIDVRNTNTNSMIENGKMLIPYEFPTLYYKSVQFNKEL